VDEVTLVVSVDAPEAPGLRDRLASLRRLAGVESLPVLVVLDEDSPGWVDRVRNVQGVVAVLQLPNRRDARWWREVTRHLDRPLVAAIASSELDQGAVRSQLVPEVEAAVEASRGLTRRTGEPLLLSTSWCARDVAAAYVEHTVANCHDERVLAHTGGLALQLGRVLGEGIDQRDGAVRIQALLDLPAPRADPWRFTVALAGPDGIVAESSPTKVRKVSEAAGPRQPYRLEGEVSLRHVGEGSWTVLVQLADAGGVRTAVRPLAPAPGVTACARTVRMAWSEAGDQREIRYLARPSGSAVVLIVQPTGRWAAARWRLARLRDDVAHVLSGSGSKRMRLLDLVRLMTAPLFLRRRPWLVGERPGIAEDNGFHLFRYLRQEHPRAPVYYILDRQSSRYRDLARLGHVVPHSSLRHRLLMLHADVLVNAFSLNYLVPSHWDVHSFHRHLAWRIGARRVFLQHGVHLSPSSLKRRTTGYDMILTSARHESAALTRATGYRDQIAETGLPRYDALHATDESRTIIFMTTWRRYLPSPVVAPPVDPFLGSTYERFISTLLASAELEEILSRHGYRVLLLPHANIAGNLTQMESKNPHVSVVTDPGQPVQQMLLDADALITDHSSVHFDVAYMGKPVIYSRFDRQEFETRHAAPSWFNFETDGFGPVTYTLGALLRELEGLLARGCVREDVYTERVERFFTHLDRRNTERVVTTIDSLVAGHRPHPPGHNRDRHDRHPRSA